MEPIAWFAGTPEGERLGKLAVEMVRVEAMPVPLWFAPLEPLRWFISVISIAPHAKYTGLTYVFLSLLFGVFTLWKARYIGWRSLPVAFSGACNALLTLSGLFLLMGWLTTILPFGMRWVVPSDAPFILADFHVHTQVSSGFLTPEKAVLWHWRKGYRVVAITDSNTVRGGMEAAAFVERTNLPVTVVVGEEFRGKTHLLLLGIRESISPSDADTPEAIRGAKQQGGVVIAAHAWTGRHRYEDLVNWGIDGFEVTNGTTFGDERLLSLCRGKGLAVLGNLDFRAGNRPGAATVLPRWATTPGKVLEALRRGECAALYFPKGVGPPRFHFPTAFKKTMADLWGEGKKAFLLGLAFWALLFTLWRRKRPSSSVRRKPLPLSLFLLINALIVALFLLVTSFGVWAMSWSVKMKGAWYPPLELVLGLWGLVCPLNWWLWCPLTFRVVPLNTSGRSADTL